EYDNVMNQQRTVVYDLRNAALLSEDMSESVLDALESVVRARLEKLTGGEKGHRDEWNLKAVVDELSFLLRTPIAVAELEAADYAQLEERVVERAVQAYRGREAEFTAPVLRDLERHLFLRILDDHWRDHLYELDHLKGGIGLRAYGQRDPLVEYKREAFALFETLLDEVNEDFVSHLFRVQLVPEAMPVMEQRPRPRQTTERHEAAAAFGGALWPGGGGAGGAPQAPGVGPRSAPADGGGRPAPVHSGPRVGRNDPCPCGSGKKYKKCHMLIDQGVGTGA
ncbi:MAG: SEC-C metal-binding domain-containing protein, partial [Candidatus Eisenbacteria bacterium]